MKYLKYLLNLDFVPRGTLTQGAGWVGLGVAGACFLGHPLPFTACPADPGQAFLTALASVIGIGLGRRG